MSYPYTFKINTVDYSDCIKQYGYSTKYDPVFSNTVTTLDKVDHMAIIRRRHTLTIEVKPLETTRLSQLTTALTAGIPSITFTSLQQGADVTCNMHMDSDTVALLLQNKTHKWLGGTTLTFVEL